MAWWPRSAKRESEIADGEVVVVTGFVRALGPLLESPLKGLPAVAYHSVAKISERRIGNQYPSRLLTSVYEHLVVPFELETPERTIRIEVAEVELAIPLLPSVPRHLERERAFLAKHASETVDVRTSIFEERCVQRDARVEIQGLAISEADPTVGEHGFRAAALRFRIVGYDKFLVRIRSAR